jgi:hypothetical protein
MNAGQAFIEYRPPDQAKVGESGPKSADCPLRWGFFPEVFQSSANAPQASADDTRAANKINLFAVMCLFSFLNVLNICFASYRF